MRIYVKHNGAAMQSITRLSLDVDHQISSLDADHKLNVCSAIVRQHTRQQQEHEQGDMVGQFVSGGVFSMLPSAVPNLQELYLRGSCLDVALPIFGALCPLLTSLHVQAPHVRCSALLKFGAHLPNLASLILWGNEEQCEHNEHLGTYLTIVLRWAGLSKTLTSLQLDFPPNMEVNCEPKTWDLLPTSLQYLRCPCLVELSEYSGSFEALLRRVPRLSLQQPPCRDLLELAKEFPQLRSFTQISNPAHPSRSADFDEEAQDPERLTIDCSQLDRGDMALITERFADGSLHLDCKVNFIGTSEEVCNALKGLPTLAHVRDVRVCFVGQVKIQRLKRLSRLFPEGRILTLHDDGEWETLITTRGFTQMCKSLRGLNELILQSGMCANKTMIRAVLRSLGRRVLVYQRG